MDSFKNALVKLFPPPQAPAAANPDAVILYPSPSPQYYSCPVCFAFFLLISRLLNYTQKENYSKITCKHCKKAFALNNKLHEHVRLYYNQKPATPPASATSSITPFAAVTPRTPLHVFLLAISHLKPLVLHNLSTSPTTPPPTFPHSSDSQKSHIQSTNEVYNYSPTSVI